MPDSTKQGVAHEKYQRLVKAAQGPPTIKVAIAHPCDDVSLQAAIEAARLQLVEPILVGPVERIRGAAKAAGLDIDAIEIVASEHSHESAAKAVGLVTAGRAEALMKGSLHTDELMGAVVAREAGIRTARRISHCFIMDVPNHPDALIITDAAVNIRHRAECDRPCACDGCHRGAGRAPERDGDGDSQGPIHHRGCGTL
jgi:phosphate acetyltransferase